MTKTYQNACDMTPEEREQAVTSWFAYVEKRKVLCAEAYGADYSCSAGGCASLKRYGRWNTNEIIHEVADAWLAGAREFWVRCGGSRMRATMNEFPILTIVEQINTDDYGFQGIGARVRPENCNEVKRWPVGEKS